MLVENGATMRAGAGLPLSRTRRISFTAADGLTSNRKAAWRIELPFSTARTIRSRRSSDKGAGMEASRLNLMPPQNQPSRFQATAIRSKVRSWRIPLKKSV